MKLIFYELSGFMMYMKAPIRSLLFLLLLSILHGQNIRAQDFNFDILGDKDEVTIPFEYFNNFIILRVRVNKILPLRFIFDTGAEYTLLFKKEYTDLLGVEYDRRIPIVGSDLSSELYAIIARNVELDIQNIQNYPRDILVLEDDYFKLDEITGTFIDGLLGGEIFRNYVVRIDFKKAKLIISRRAIFEIPGRKYDAYPIEIERSKPYLDAEVTLTNETTIDVRLLIDTGAGLPLLLHTNSHPSLYLPEHVIGGRLGKGLGGYLEGYVGRINELHIGDLMFNDILTSYQELDSTFLESRTVPRNGLIGNQLLQRFDVIIDYLGKTLYLDPKSKYDREFIYDRSGLVIIAVGHRLQEFLISDILPNSPASECGLKRGDIIRKIQIYPSFVLSLQDLSDILKKRVNKKIRIVVERNGKRLKFKFRLRELL